MAFAVLALLAVGVSSAFGDEGTVAGPPACSALIEHSASAPGRADLWVQCNYEVSEIGAKSANRKLRKVAPAAELLGARPGDALTCGLKSGSLSCRGRLQPLARAHIRLKVNDYACNKPLMRLSVYSFGGPRCDPGQICAEAGFSNWTPAALAGFHRSCNGG